MNFFCEKPISPVGLPFCNCQWDSFYTSGLARLEYNYFQAWEIICLREVLDSKRCHSASKIQIRTSKERWKKEQKVDNRAMFRFGSNKGLVVEEVFRMVDSKADEQKPSPFIASKPATCKKSPMWAISPRNSSLSGKVHQNNAKWRT